MVHELKTHPKYFEKIWNGDKKFEIRKNDRNFQEGDLLKLLEYDPEICSYTGRYCIMKISYILHDFPGLEPGYCVMSIHLNHYIPK